MLENFKIDCLAHFINEENKENLISEEGFFQKIYLNFKYKKSNNNVKKNILNFLSLAPKPDIILYFNTKISTCIERTKKRKRGFSYIYKKKFVLDEKNNFNKYILNFAKKNKIKILKINGINSMNKDIKKILKILKN